jgi:tryptophan-rich sensory protein
MRFVKSLALCGAAVAVAATLGGLFNPGRGGTREWYRALEKPPFTPPDEIFAPVWTVLYMLIAISGARIASAAPSAERTRALRWWCAQLALNAAWSPLFFGAQMPAVALANIVIMLVAIAMAIITSRKVDGKAAWMMAPYFAWVCYATALNAEIVRRASVTE